MPDELQAARTKAGAATAILLVLTMGGVRIKWPDQFRTVPRSPTAYERAAKSHAAEEARHAVAMWERQQAAIHEIQALQSEHNLTDDQLSEILKGVWKQNNPDREYPPWQFRLGGMKPEDWWTLYHWHTQTIKRTLKSPSAPPPLPQAAAQRAAGAPQKPVTGDW